MTRIVIIGAGIAGVPAAYAIRNLAAPQDKVIVVSDKDYFHFVPSNPWVAMGWRERGETAFPIEPHLAERNIEFIAQAALRVLPKQNQVELADGSVVGYDYLLLATGPEAAFDEIEGLQAYTHSVIHIEHAEQSHAAYREFIKNPGPIVLGAAQNSSILGPIYEFAFLADADLRRRNIRDRVPIKLVTPEPYAGHLGLGAEGETRSLLEAALKERNIEVVCNAKTVRVEPGKIHIMQCDEHGKDKEARVLPFAYSVYWPAFRGVWRRNADSGLANARGFIVVDEYLHNPKFTNIFAVGVCGAHAPVAKTGIPIGAPDSVYSIQSEVDTAVQNILAAINGNELISAVPRRAKWLTDMGESGASYLSEPQIPLRNINWLKQGRWVHMAKVEFEKYFINKIKLKSIAHAAPATGSHIATAVRLLQQDTGKAAQARSRATAKPVEVPLPRELSQELRAMAKALKREPGVLAAELLNAAIRDAKSYLGGACLEDMEIARREILHAELPENQPGVEFHGGGT